MSLEALNWSLKESMTRKDSSSGKLAEDYQKEIDMILRVREAKWGVSSG